jgi:hypothetical protein
MQAGMHCTQLSAGQPAPCKPGFTGIVCDAVAGAATCADFCNVCPVLLAATG